MKSVHAAFDLDGITLPLSAIHPIRQIKPTDHAWGKYRSMLASIREVGVIEPLIVHPQRGTRGSYVLLDGHMRLKALAELGRPDAFCLVAKDDDAFTYNDKVTNQVTRSNSASLSVGWSAATGRTNWRLACRPWASFCWKVAVIDCTAEAISRD